MNETDIILNDIKQMVGVQVETTEFDTDIMSDINSAFFTLYQLGIGPAICFQIDSTTTWGDLSTSVPKGIIQNYLYLKTRLMFDPPTISSVIESYKNQISELEFRMNIEVDNGGGQVTG